MLLTHAVAADVLFLTIISRTTTTTTRLFSTKTVYGYKHDDVDGLPKD
jgi:hypothetical protein